MKKLVFLIIMVSFCFVSCKSSYTKIGDKNANYIPYYLKVYEADSLYITGNYQRSYELLDSLFVKYEPVNILEYYEFSNYHKLKSKLNKKITNKEIENLVVNCGFTLQNLAIDSLKSLSSSQKRKINSNYLVWREKYLNSLNISLRQELILMKENDQLYRKSNYQQNIDKQNSIDSINSIKMKFIFENFGFPNEKIVGNYSIDNKEVSVVGILLHTKDDERINYFLPKVLSFVENGSAWPKIYAVMYDQYYLYNGEEQYFGSYENKVSTPVHILNERRKKIGLPNYGYEKWRIKMMYPDEEF